MAASAVGVIFTNLHEENIPELIRRRTVASIPFGGRYRLIDFQLSNMVNSGITTIGLMTNNNYRSLLDHLGSGKDWDLARKDGGIILLPPYSDTGDKPYRTRLEGLKGLRGFLTKRREKYVVLSDSDGVFKLDISAVIDYHEEKNADLTMVTSKRTNGGTSDCIYMKANESGRVTDVIINSSHSASPDMDVGINVTIINRQYLINLVEDAVIHGYKSFKSDIIAKQINNMKIYRYDFKGYYASINSLAAYYKHNLELLNKDVRNELFGDRDIYTKVRDSAPSKYGSTAVVKNSLISDGCNIEGTVENSILFRGVKVAKGAVVKNSIVMQDTLIGDNAMLDGVITDKNVVISDKRMLCGCADLPYYIHKGTML